MSRPAIGKLEQHLDVEIHTCKHMESLMWSQTVIPTSREVTVEVPEALLNQPVEVVLIPTQLSEDRETRRRQLQAFFEQFQADAGLLKYSRDELHER
jgi:hypothetical protein